MSTEKGFANAALHFVILIWLMIGSCDLRIGHNHSKSSALQMYSNILGITGGRASLALPCNCIAQSSICHVDSASEVESVEVTTTLFSGPGLSHHSAQNVHGNLQRIAPNELLCITVLHSVCDAAWVPLHQAPAEAP